MLKNLFLPCNLLAPGETTEIKFSVDQRVSPTANSGGRCEQQKAVESLCLLSLPHMLVIMITCVPSMQVSRETTQTVPEIQLSLLWSKDSQEQVQREEELKIFFCPTQNSCLLQKFCTKPHVLHAVQDDGVIRRRKQSRSPRFKIGKVGNLTMSRTHPWEGPR